MRVSSKTFPGVVWLVWHVPRCCEVRRCLWVDDVTHEYAVIDEPVRPDGAGGVVQRVHRARRVLIDVQARVVLIDPLDDEAPAVATAVERGTAGSHADSVRHVNG